MLGFEDWGLIDYQQAWDRQKVYAGQIQRGERGSTLIFCQHPSVITIGRAGSAANITADAGLLQERGIQVIENNRGGDVTLHNPGQLVGYPLFHLSHYKEDLHWFLREIEQCIIESIAEFGIMSGRVQGLTGVWVGEERKICAIGIHCSRWVTSHGFALNVENDLSEFGYIIPCGIEDKEVTSVCKESHQKITIEEVAKKCRGIFEQKF